MLPVAPLLTFPIHTRVHDIEVGRLGEDTLRGRGGDPAAAARRLRPAGVRQGPVKRLRPHVRPRLEPVHERQRPPLRGLRGSEGRTGQALSGTCRSDLIATQGGVRRTAASPRSRRAGSARPVRRRRPAATQRGGGCSSVRRAEPGGRRRDGRAATGHARGTQTHTIRFSELGRTDAMATSDEAEGRPAMEHP